MIDEVLNQDVEEFTLFLATGVFYREYWYCINPTAVCSESIRYSRERVHTKTTTTSNQHCTAAPVTLLRAVCQLSSKSGVIIVVATRIPLQLGTTNVTKKELLCYPMTYDVT